MEERVQVWLSRAGFGSRRACETLIREGRVSIGSHPVQLGDKLAEPTNLRVDGQAVRLPTVQAHFLLHKPRGYVSTMNDPEGRPTVADLMPKFPGRLFPVGRLDFGAEGLLLITSDGQLANALVQSRFGVEQEYAVKLRGPLDEKQLTRIRRGVVEEGERLKLKSITPLPSRSTHAWYSIVLTEAKNHHIRRMMQVMPAQVLRVKRIRMGLVKLGQLPMSQLRPLEPNEIAALQGAVRKGPSKAAQDRAARKARLQREEP